MNWDAIAALGSIGTAVFVVAAAFITHGRYSKTVEEHTEKLSEHQKLLGLHGDKLNEHEVELARVDEWRKGFSAAANIKGS